MKSLIPLLVSGFIAPSALAGGLEYERLDRASFCGDPVIRHLDRGIFVNGSRYCCVFGDPWIAANNSAGCCICRSGPGESPGSKRHNL
jgi:hypothetical protein